MIGQHRHRVTLTGAHGSLILTTFEDGASDDGLEIWVTDLQGWDGGTGVEAADVQRKIGHGMLSYPARRTGRTLTLKGTIIAKGLPIRELASRFTSSLLWDGELGALSVESDNGILTCEVRIDGDPKIEHLGDTAFNFELPLLAPEPWLYGPAVATQIFPAGTSVGLRFNLFAPDPKGVISFGSQASQSAAIAHEGNVTAHPTYIIRGEWSSGFRITNGDRVIEYPYSVITPSPVTIDCTRGTVTINGADHTADLTRRDWHSIPAKSGFAPTIEALAPATGWCDVIVRDTYL